MVNLQKSLSDIFGIVFEVGGRISKVFDCGLVHKLVQLSCLGFVQPLTSGSCLLNFEHQSNLHLFLGVCQPQILLYATKSSSFCLVDFHMEVLHSIRRTVHTHISRIRKATIFTQDLKMCGMTFSCLLLSRFITFGDLNTVTIYCCLPRVMEVWNHFFLETCFEKNLRFDKKPAS